MAATLSFTPPGGGSTWTARADAFTSIGNSIAPHKPPEA